MSRRVIKVQPTGGFKAMKTASTAAALGGEDKIMEVVPGVAYASLGLPTLKVFREGRKPRTPFGLDPTRGWAPLRLAKRAIILFSFDWTSWGNRNDMSDVKSQTLQEVTNFGVISALAMSLGLSLALVAESNNNWDGPAREVLGVLFQVGNSSFIITLLSSALLLLIINEVPEGRPASMVIEATGAWLKVPGISFAMGIYLYAATLALWQLHTFNVVITAVTLGIMTLVASFTLFSLLGCAIANFYFTVTTHSLLSIDKPQDVDKLRECFLQLTCAGQGEFFQQRTFMEWILEVYDAHGYADLTERRVDREIKKWQNGLLQKSGTDPGKDSDDDDDDAGGA